MRRGPGSLYRKLLTLAYLASRDRRAAARFLLRRDGLRRLAMLRRFAAITNAVRGYHTMAEMLEIADAVLARAAAGPPTVVECGVAYGSSTAKLSVAVAAAGGRLLAFDSFRGIPANDEVHRHMDGRPAVFREGAFRGRRAAVERVLERWGEPVVKLHKGLFADTLPEAAPARIDVAVLDVDLLASTRTCIRVLYPRLAPGGVLFTQDGHLEAVAALLGDARFWRDEVGVPPPPIDGLGRRKLLAVPAPVDTAAAGD